VVATAQTPLYGILLVPAMMVLLLLAAGLLQLTLAAKGSTAGEAMAACILELT
jgi:hypothetical protein